MSNNINKTGGAFFKVASSKFERESSKSEESKNILLGCVFFFNDGANELCLHFDSKLNINNAVTKAFSKTSALFVEIGIINERRVEILPEMYLPFRLTRKEFFYCDFNLNKNDAFKDFVNEKMPGTYEEINASNSVVFKSRRNGLIAGERFFGDRLANPKIIFESTGFNNGFFYEQFFGSGNKEQFEVLSVKDEVLDFFELNRRYFKEAVESAVKQCKNPIVLKMFELDPDEKDFSLKMTNLINEAIELVESEKNGDKNEK